MQSLRFLTEAFWVQIERPSCNLARLELNCSKWMCTVTGRHAFEEHDIMTCQGMQAWRRKLSNLVHVLARAFAAIIASV